MSAVVQPVTHEPSRAWKHQVIECAERIRQKMVNSNGIEMDANEFRMCPRSFAYHVDSSGALVNGSGTFIHVYGCDERGDTVAVQVTGYSPYFFVRCGEATDAEVRRFVEQLNTMLTFTALQEKNGSIGSATRRAILANGEVRPVVGHEIVDCVSMKTVGEDRGYMGNKTERFARIVVYAPSLVRAARDLLEEVYETYRTSPGERDTVRGFAAFCVEAVRNGGRQANEKNDAAPGAKGIGENAPNPWQDARVDVSSTDLGDEVDNEDDADDIDVSSEGAVEMMELMRAGLVESSHSSSEVSKDAWAHSLQMNDECPQIYEADVDFVIRYLIDAGFKAEEWVTVTGPFESFKPTYQRRGSSNLPTSSWSVSCNWTQIRRVPDDDVQITVPPQICMSFDCEMETGTNNQMPNPLTERVLQICCVMFDPVKDKLCNAAEHVAFCIDSVAMDPNASPAPAIFSFYDEHAMLQAFSLFVQRVQPDMMTGWNIEGFDLPYLLERANVIKCAEFRSFCRLSGAEARMTERTFNSRAHGTHVYKEVKGEGLWVWDLYTEFKRSTTYKFRSYSLEYVSNTILNDRKEDVSYKEINGLQKNPVGRWKLMRYCLKDALLPARIIGDRVMLVEKIELARATGVPMDLLCRRGLQIRLKSCLYREARYEQVRHVFYTRTAKEHRTAMGAGKYKGAYVHEPVLGYHDVPVVTLDFKSLYPSIMVTLNMCVTTLIPKKALNERKRKFNVAGSAVWEPPGGDDCDDDEAAFLKFAALQGLVPRILRKLLAMRKIVKKLMKEAEKRGDMLLAAIYNERQLAIKLNCNSIYGIFGATSSFSYCPEIAAMVTATGREMILETKQLVEEHFTRKNGYPFDATIIYGDTDSVFVKLSKDVTMQESAKFGKEMAAFVTAHFRKKYGAGEENIIELVYEKSFSKLIFYAKKRYVGWKWVWNEKENVLKQNSEPEASGMETERRDSCLLVSNGVRDVLRILLENTEGRTAKQTLQEALNYIAVKLIKPIENNTVDWSQIIESMQIRMPLAEYKARGRTPPIHIQLAGKLDARKERTGSSKTYVPGDRIQYVVTDHPIPGMKTSSCAEDPDYAWEHNMKLNQDHYVQNGIKNTMLRVLKPMLAPNDDKSHVSRSMVAILADNDRNLAAQTPSSTQSSMGVFARYAVSVLRRCELCGALLPASATSSVCSSHAAEEVVVHEGRKKRSRDEMGAEREELWKTCMACERGWTYDENDARVSQLPPPPPDIESLEHAKQCNNCSCNIYWKRRRVDRLLK